MLDLLFKLPAYVIHQVRMELRALEDAEIAQIGLANGDEITTDNYHDVYASRIGFSTERGRLKKED